MGVALDEFFETVQQVKAEEKRSHEIWKKTWHIEYFLFSLNKDMFGFVYHHWYPSGGYYYPDEYDYDYEKGFKLYDKDYRCDVIDLEIDDAKFDKENQYEYATTDWKWILNIKCIPLLVYKKEQVGYITPDGTKKYFKKEEKEYKRKWKKETREIKKMRKTMKKNGEEYFEM